MLRLMQLTMLFSTLASSTMAQVIFNARASTVDSLITDTSSVRRAAISTCLEADNKTDRINRPSSPDTERRIDSLLETTAIARAGDLKRSLLADWVVADWLCTIPSIPPVRLTSKDSYRISSRFGWRIHPVRHKAHVHTGIDLPCPTGTPVYSTADGMVTKVAWDQNGLGLTVYVKHLSGYVSIYGHLSSCAVRQGDYVKRGTNIGRVGSTGNATGPHLHYAVLYKEKPINPERFCLLWLKWLDVNISTAN